MDAYFSQSIFMLYIYFIEWKQNILFKLHFKSELT